MTAILISTFDRYERLARWTADRISECWPGHPPVFFAGLNKPGPQHLAFHGSERDWMSVNLQAVRKLQGKGFSHAYLILDDHPPVGPCHAEVLNSSLPGVSRNLDAACIGLLGYGQHRRIEGRVLSADRLHLEHSNADYRWKFSLHPGLWKLADLATLLECRMTKYAGDDRSPWNFERHRDDPSEPVIGPIAARCFRVRGSSCLPPVSGQRSSLAVEAASRFLADIRLFLSNLAGGQSARDAAELRVLWRFGHYQGPYPLFWSGTMRQGKPHADFEKWLAVGGPPGLRSSWAAARTECFLE